MRYLLGLAAALVVMTSVHAADLSEAALQGSWRIVAFSGEPTEENDKWQFDGNKFYQNFDGKRMSPDRYEVTNNSIDLGYAKITVTSFGGSRMTATMAGFKYELEKVN